MPNYNGGYLKGNEATVQSIVKENSGWLETIPTMPIHEAVQIIDDALCHLFEFKVENHKLYYREIV